ncbi:MAG: division/cell wall cluster transcriptional repressor MraZ [Clostridia bacterium]
MDNEAITENAAEEKEFIGEYCFNMDTKGRITLPAKYREELGEGFYVTKGYDGCLSVYDKKQWAKFSGEIKSLPVPRRAARFSQRTFLSGADKPVPDKQGKILISLSHREYAKLTKEVVIVGVGDHIEIWDQQRWIDYNNNESMSLEQAADELNGLMQR